MKVLIVDDEDLARQRLGRLLLRLRPDAELFEAAEGRSAIERVADLRPDILFLDIRMPGLDGVAVARAMLELEDAPAIIFCTAYDEYALEALRHQAAAYLLKPVRERDLEAALQAAVRVNRAQLAALGVAAGGRTMITSAGHRGVDALPVADVRCLLAEDKYVRACAPQGELLLSESLRELELEFEGRFLRVHRNALVSRAHLRRLLRDDEGWTVELGDSRERPRVSRRHVAAVKAAISGED
ncbi:MAG: LytTR family DNA-binding domain-containing protein [Pseudomonadota bacterium]